MAANQGATPPAVVAGRPPPRAGSPFSEEEVMDLIACVEEYGREWAKIKADPRFGRGNSNRENDFNLRDKWIALVKRANDGRATDFLTPAILARILRAQANAEHKRGRMPNFSSSGKCRA